MSLDAMLWAVKDAPVADVEEHAVLTVLADEADEAGCGAFLSTQTIGERSRLAPRTVQRRLDAMVGRGLLGHGDQTLAAYIRADRRPVVYDLLIPYSAFANVDRVNRARAGKGLPPLTPDNRPDIDPAPAPKRRADAGKKKPPKQQQPDGASTSHPEEVHPQTDSHPADGVTTSPTGLQDTHGVTTSPPRGVYKSPDPVVDPVTTNPSPPPTSSYDPAQEEKEEDPQQTETPTAAAVDEAFVAELAAARPDWSPRVIRQVLADPEIRSRQPGIVLAAFRAAARDPKTRTPRRMLHDYCPHWAAGARQAGLIPAHAPDASDGQRQADGCPDGVCDGTGRYTRIVETTRPVLRRDGSISQETYDQVKRETCPTCSAPGGQADLRRAS